jgi:hypothetical protein
MRVFSVVLDEPGDQLAIKLGRSDEQLLMVINELLLNGPVKPFDVGNSFWEFWDGMPMVLCKRLISSSKCFMNSEPLSVNTD